jgi:predicted metal-dependent phosphoesterase TrpH
VARAAAARLGCFALTDHDTTDGLAEARQAAAAAGIELVPGVEISVTWGAQTVHVVGLGIDPAHPELASGLAGLIGFRDWRAEEIGRRLALKGIEGAHAGALALSGGRLVARTHFARFLVERRLAANERDCFKRYLTRGKPGHVPGDWASLESALGWIRAAGGQAVLAHPARYRLTRTRLLRLVGEFRELGGAALEAVSGSHNREDAFNFARLAQEQGLLASAGSDFHAPPAAASVYPWIDLGRLPALPAGCTPIWHDWPGQAGLPGPRCAACA